MGTESHYHSKKDRIFVRAIQGQYSLREELARLRAMPRVLKGEEIKFVDGPQAYSRHYVEPKDGISQMFHLHLEEYAPGGRSQKHGHVNEAAFYILDGKGYEIHDGVRYDWQAGDVAIVHNNCVHQHFNASPDKPARALVIKTKPMYMFMNMLFQKLIEPRPTAPAPGAGSVGRGTTSCWNSMFMNMYIGFDLMTRARAGLSGLALKCWCTQLLCTIATSPACQS